MTCFYIADFWAQSEFCSTKRAAICTSKECNIGTKTGQHSDVKDPRKRGRIYQAGQGSWRADFKAQREAENLESEVEDDFIFVEDLKNDEAKNEKDNISLG